MEIRNHKSWSSDKIVEGLTTLQDQNINIIPVLEQFTPNHVHIPYNYQSMFLRIILEESLLFPVIDMLCEQIVKRYLALRGLPSKYVGGMALIYPEEGSHWSARNTLMFPWIDYQLRPKQITPDQYVPAIVDLNTTRVRDTTYQVYVRSLPEFTGSEFTITSEEQDLIKLMISSRIA